MAERDEHRCVLMVSRKADRAALIESYVQKDGNGKRQVINTEGGTGHPSQPIILPRHFGLVPFPFHSHLY